MLPVAKYLTFLVGSIALLSPPFVVAAIVDPPNYFPTSINSAYVDWYDSRGAANYQHSAFIPLTSDENSVNDGVAIHWTLIPEDDNNADGKIHLAVAVPATGWVGFGIAEAGGMPGSDIVLFETSNPITLIDAFVEDAYVKPTPDTHYQDWNLLHSQTNDGFLIFEAERLLDTGDPQDRSINFDGNLLIQPHRIIAAWGDDTSEVSYHGNKRVRSSIRFYPLDQQEKGTQTEVFAERMSNEADGYIDLLMDSYNIRSYRDTDYVDICFTYQDLIDLGMPTDTEEEMHIIGIEPIITNTKHLHHMTVESSSYGGEIFSCTKWSVMGRASDLELIYGWAPGQYPEEMPEDAGISFGGPTGGRKFFMINYHYDNRDGDQGQTDSSGIRLYYTKNKRKYDIGVLQLGDPQIFLDGTKVGDGLTKHTFDCPSTCTNTYLKGINNNREITIFKESLHMHGVGVVMKNEVLTPSSNAGSKATLLRESKVQYWDFEQAGVFTVQQEPYTLKAGDTFRTTCFFNDTTKNSGINHFNDEPISYGLGSLDEMCIAFIFYYPKQAFPLGVCGIPKYGACGASFNSESVTNDDEIGRVFGSIKPPPPSTPSPTAVEESDSESVDSGDVDVDGDVDGDGDVDVDVDVDGDGDGNGTSSSAGRLLSLEFMGSFLFTLLTIVIT